MTLCSSLQPHFVVWSNDDHIGNMRSSIGVITVQLSQVRFVSRFLV